MFFLPTYGRPEKLREVLQACVDTGMTSPLTVIVNGGGTPIGTSPTYEFLSAKFHSDLPNLQWTWHDENLGFNGALAEAFSADPDLSWYGIMSDDAVPSTPGWDQQLIAHLKTHRIVSSNDLWQANADPDKSRLSPVSVFDGELLRTMGFWFKPELRHFYADDILEGIGRKFRCWKIDMDVVCEHRHFMNEKAKRDATHDISYSDAAAPEREADRKVYHAWLTSPERRKMEIAIGKLIGGMMSMLEPEKIRLAICIPIGDRAEETFYDSLRSTEALLSGWNVQYCLIKSVGGSHIGKARERILWNAMYYAFPDGKLPTHLLFIDADMGWDAGLVLRLLTADHDFAAAVGVRKTDEPSLCCNFLPGYQRFHKRTQFIEVRDVGFAFVMLKRETIEAMSAGYPSLRYKADREEYALFLDMIDPEPGETIGERLSEDFAFCRRWRALGGQIFVDHKAALLHIGKKAYTGKPSDVFELEDAPGKAAAD